MAASGGGVDRDVEALFQSKTIAEVREVEARTRHEIEEKKKQLRLVVGNSYRDLIASADTIVEISRSCHHAVDVIASIQGGLAELSASIAARSAGAPAARSSAASGYDKLHAIGSRVKYLLDTPEVIWGCLDSHDYLGAARRYVRAEEVHQTLSKGPGRGAAARFPLLQHQWPLVRKFKAQVAERAAAWLAAAGAASGPQLAAALAALALLSPLGGTDLLKTYLAARRNYVFQCLTAVTGGGGTEGAGAAGAAAPAAAELPTLSVVLRDVAAVVCATVAQAGELFLVLPGVQPAPLMAALLSGTDPGDSDLAFGAGSGAEAAAWEAVRGGAAERLGQLSAGGVALEVGQWLEALGAEVRGAGGALLAACSSGADLLSVELAVRAAMDSWTFALPAQEGGASEATVLTWPDVCQWALGRPVALWPLLLEGPLLDRAKDLISRDFTTVVEEATALLGTALRDASGLPASAPGSYQLGSWAEEVELRPTTPTPGGAAAGAKGGRRRRARRPSSGDGSAAAGAQAQRRAWLQSVEAVHRMFDHQLARALDAALDACRGGLPAAESAQPGRPGAAAAHRKPSGWDSAAGRALVLEPFVQDRCAEAADGICSVLEASVLSLPRFEGTAAEAPAFAPAAQKALILGHVALAIAAHSATLAAVMGPPDQWQTARAAAASPGTAAVSRAEALRRMAAAPAAPSPRLERIQQKYRAVGAAAAGIWADWAAAGLASQLVVGLASDPALRADTPLRCWEETVVEGGEVDVASGVEGTALRFELPAAPSPAVLAAVLGACKEVDRAGGHALDEELLQLLKWRLGGAAMAALRSAVQPGGALAAGGGGGGLSERGVLQLLFDVRLLVELLPGGPPLPARAADAAAKATAALAARRREVFELESELTAALDPIDWATYEPYLYANKDCFLARCQVLFGMLMRAERPRAGAPAARAPASSDCNVLRLAPPGARFAYLPINTPSLMRHTSLHAPEGGAPEMASAAAAQSEAAMPLGDDGALYSFAFVEGVQRSRRSVHSGVAEEAAGSGMGAAAGKLVGLLGDKAAEAAASLGDFSGQYSFTGLSDSTRGLLSSLNLPSFKK